MAALMEHAYRAVNPIAKILLAPVTSVLARHNNNYSTKGTKVDSLLSSCEKSIAARGFLRNIRPYEPPNDVEDKINKICKDRSISTNGTTSLQDPVLRFKILTACEKEFKHYVPNSLLCYVQTVRDLKEFYLTPIDCGTPLDALQRIELPKNLHVTYDYHRFHPDTDTKFGGKTAFPESSTIVTGLKYKKKYPGHVQDTPYKAI